MLKRERLKRARNDQEDTRDDEEEGVDGDSGLDLSRADQQSG